MSERRDTPVPPARPTEPAQPALASRRDIFKVLALAGGGMALGFELPGCAPAKMPFAAGGDFAPNAWLRITTQDRILFALDRVEMGQGTTTSHATLLAEELDVDPRRLQVVAAPAHRAYDNPDPALGFQITGGSSSVRESFLPLRKAGATAREMLRRAGAKTWAVPLDECTAVDGVVEHRPSGKKAKYGDLATVASTLPIPSETKLKAPAELRFIGKKVDRLDTRPKVDGSGIYGIDVTLPGLLTAVVLRPPSVGGKVVSFDATKAKALPGVVDVVKIPSGVAVVATSYYRARAASKAVDVTFEDGPNVSTDSLRKAFQTRLDSPAKVSHARGSVTSAFEKASRKLEARYEVPYLAHATLEPQNATVHLHDGVCEIWAPTQSPGLAREVAHGITGIAHDNIHVHTTLIGGGFGRRLAQDYVAEAVHVAVRVKRPVKVLWSREDDMTHDPYRPMSAHALVGSLDAAGNVSGWQHRIVSQSIVAHIARDFVTVIPPNAMPGVLKLALARTGAALYGSSAVEDSTSVEGAADMAYAIPAFRAEYAPVETGVPVGFWRAVGFSENVFVVESFLDELAHAAKADPLAFRLALLSEAPRNRRVLALAAEKAGWGKPTPNGVFRGLAQTRAFSTYSAQVAEVSVEGGAIRVHRVVAAVDCGTVVNPDIVRAQVEGGIIFGLSAALHQQITLSKGRVRETNFHELKLLRMHETPEIEVHIVDSQEPPTGIGEPGLPPIAPAVANAVFAATGIRLRRLPLLASLAEHLAGHR